MNQPIVCAPHMKDTYLLINRLPKGYKAASIDKNSFEHIVECYNQEPGKEVPEWLRTVLQRIGYEVPLGKTMKETILPKERGLYHYGSASYELTWNCNFNCPFCYLGERTDKSVKMARTPLSSLETAQRILEKITESGALFLQLTGGEVLTHKFFSEIYSYAYEKGFLINISSNGSLMPLCSDIQKTLETLPPRRLSLSLYGTCKDTYETVTKSQGTFEGFLECLAWVKSAAFPLRLNAIITKDNEPEKPGMIEFAEKFGAELYFYYLSPNIDCKAVNVEYGAKESSRRQISFDGCSAGVEFFSVNPFGDVCACKISPDQKEISIFDPDIFQSLPKLNREILEPPSSTCPTCVNNGGLCPPEIKLNQASLRCQCHKLNKG